MRRPWLLATLLTVACAPTLPPRYVIEKDVGPYRYRRYQAALDVEVPIADNPAKSHLATYVRSGPPMAVSPVSVTHYAHAEGLADAARGVLRGMDAYQYAVVEHAGHWMWQLKGEQQDLWWVWTSGASLVKVGAPTGKEQVPSGLVEAYLDLYPSDLDEQGRPD